VEQSLLWRHLVLESRACVVLVGRIELSAHLDAEMRSKKLRRLLGRAARAGDLVGVLAMARVC
jgi:hypothetical protein